MSLNIIKFIVADDRAILPKKAHPTDIGYDLTAIDVFKKYSSKTTLFETGIAISPPAGYYVEIVPRSSMSSTGYMLANSIGVIDPDYTATLKIAMIKIDDSYPDISLPFTKCQLVLRRAESSDIIQVDTFDHNSDHVSFRGDGGFGSTDN